MAHPAWWQVNGDLDQQGPGSDASTLRALAALPDVPDAPRIADLGCGPGRQTLALARATGGRIAALDILPPFLMRLRDRARRGGLERHIDLAQCDMGRPPLGDAGFDLDVHADAARIPPNEDFRRHSRERFSRAKLRL